MRVALLAIVMAMGAGATGSARAQDALSLDPSSPWAVDYDADSCALRRWFGAGEDQVYLEARRFGPGLGLQTVIASKGMKARNPPRFRYRFGTDGEWQEPGIPLVVMLADEFSGVVFEPSLFDWPAYAATEDPVELQAILQSSALKTYEREQAAAADSITLRDAFGRDLTLRIGRLSAPIGALQDCIDDLMTHWNIDVEAHRTLTRPAWPRNFALGARLLDYPPKMYRIGMTGLVNVRLAIDERGKITACRVQMPLSDPDFEESSCGDIQRGFDFDPALDKDGKPIPSYWITTVYFAPSRR